MLRIVLTLMTLPLALLSADDWMAPADACTVASPVAANAAIVSVGKSVFERNCVVCHGATGQGDGAGAAYMTPKPAKLVDPKIQGQSDGSLFWKISKGRNLMIGWAPTINEQDRWAVVAYIRSLAPKP